MKTLKYILPFLVLIGFYVVMNWLWREMPFVIVIPGIILFIVLLAATLADKNPWQPPRE